MIGKIFITRSGYDPVVGKHVKDPHFCDQPTMGACRPDIRKQLDIGDHIFVISGKVKAVDQFVIGGFEIAQKIQVDEARSRFPDEVLRRLSDGQLDGNIVVDPEGKQYPLDTHRSDTIVKRVQNYIVGRNPLVIAAPEEVEQARVETLPVLRDILKRDGASAFEVVGRYGSKLDEQQVEALRNWLLSLKSRFAGVKLSVTESILAGGLTT